MSNKLARTPSSMKLRPGEGAIVDAVVTAGDGGLSSFHIDISTAPVPQKRYVADTCMVEYSNDQVKVYFGQTKLASQALRSMLVVSMSPLSITQFLATMRPNGKDDSDDKSHYKNRFLRLGAGMGLTLEPLAQITDEPEQTAAFAANLLLFAMSGRECCLDFYHASAFSLGAVVHTKRFAVDPVVRVDIRSAVALSMVEKLEILAGQFPKDSLTREMS